MVETQLGQIIKQVRKQKGYTQATLADALGFSQQAVGKYENGLSKPGHDFIKAFRDKLNYDLLAKQNTTSVVNQEIEEDAPQYGDLESRRTLERTLENMSEDKIRSTAIIERLVTLLEKSFNSSQQVKAPLVQTVGDNKEAVPSAKEDLSLGKKYQSGRTHKSGK